MIFEIGGGNFNRILFHPLNRRRLAELSPDARRAYREEIAGPARFGRGTTNRTRVHKALRIVKQETSS